MINYSKNFTFTCSAKRYVLFLLNVCIFSFDFCMFDARTENRAIQFVLMISLN